MAFFVFQFLSIIILIKFCRSCWFSKTPLLIKILIAGFTYRNGKCIILKHHDNKSYTQIRCPKRSQSWNMCLVIREKCPILLHAETSL